MSIFCTHKNKYALAAQQGAYKNGKGHQVTSVTFFCPTCNNTIEKDIQNYVSMDELCNLYLKVKPAAANTQPVNDSRTFVAGVTCGIIGMLLADIIITILYK